MSITPLSDQDILTGLADILHDVARIPPQTVTADKSFEHDLDIDSLSMVEVATAAEDRFHVRIPDDAVVDLQTVGDAVRFIQQAAPTP